MCLATLFLTTHDTHLQKHDELWETLHRFHHQTKDGQAISTGFLLRLDPHKTCTVIKTELFITTCYPMMFITHHEHLLSSKPEKLISSNLHTVNTPPPPHLCVCVCVCAISSCTFWYLQNICLYHTCVLKSEFGHVWLLTTLVYLLNLLYANSCVVGSRMA